MIISRIKEIYNNSENLDPEKQEGYTKKGSFLLNPSKASLSSLKYSQNKYENCKREWKKDKSFFNFVGLGKAAINGKIARKELARRKKLQGLEEVNGGMMEKVPDFSSLLGVIDKD